jgi:hypothetical protein
MGLTMPSNTNPASSDRDFIPYTLETLPSVEEIAEIRRNHQAKGLPDWNLAWQATLHELRRHRWPEEWIEILRERGIEASGE